MSHPATHRTPAMLLDEWRHLTEAEAAAIAASDWSRLHAVQSTKAALQVPLLEAEAGGVVLPRATLEMLIAMEERNAAAVAASRRQAEDDRARLERSRRDLRRIHSHFQQPAASGWQSYS